MSLVPPDPPKSDSSIGWLALAALVVMIAGVVASITGATGWVGGRPVCIAIGAVVGVLGLAALIAVGVMGHRRTLREQRELAERIGFTLERPVSKESQQAFLRGLQGLKVFKNTGKLNWCASGVIERRPVAVCLHVTKTDSEGGTDQRLVAVTQCPAEWPAFEVQKGGKVTRALYGVLARMARGVLAKPLEGFDAGLVVTGADEAGIRVLLDTEFQQSVVQSPVMEQWEVNAGRLAMVVVPVGGMDLRIEWAALRLAAVANQLERVRKAR